MTDYPKPWKPDLAVLAGEKLDEIAELATSLSIEIPVLAPAREKVAHSRRFVDEMSARYEDPSALVRRIAHALVDGELDLDSAAAEIVKAKPDTALRVAAKTSEEYANRQAFARAGAEFDGDAVLEACRAVVAESLAEIRKLRKPLDGITNGEGAVEAGAKTAAAWVAYKAALTRFERVHELAKTLRELHWIKPLPIGCNPKWGRRDRVRADTQQARRAGRVFCDLLDPICDEWLPGGPYTEAEALEFEHRVRMAADERERADFERARRKVRVA